MPFSQTTPEHTEEYWRSHYNSFLKPLIEESSKVIAHRSEPLRGDILKQIINDLIVSPIVVADITDKNANVFWELGVRQSFKHGTITIAEYGTHLPFDIGGKGTLFYYPNDPIKMISFNTQFKNAIKDCLSNPNMPDSQVLESITGRGTFFEIFRQDETMRRLDAVLLECNQNLETIENLFKICKEKKENENKKEKILKRLLNIFSLHNKRSFNINLSRLSPIAVQLLVTHRYLDKTNEFYIKAGHYRMLVEITNNHLEEWPFNVKNTEEWILDNKDIIQKAINNFKAVVETAREDVSKLL